MTERAKTKKLAQANLSVVGMTCASCAANVEKALNETPGVVRANVNFASEKVAVKYDPAKVDLGRIKDVISQAGYGIAVKKSVFPVSGMTCATCVARVEGALAGVPGVVSVNVNLASEKATVEYIEGTDIVLSDFDGIQVEKSGYCRVNPSTHSLSAE